MLGLLITVACFVTLITRREKEHLTGHGQSEGSCMSSARLENSPVCCAAQAAGKRVLIWLYYIIVSVILPENQPIDICPLFLHGYCILVWWWLLRVHGGYILYLMTAGSLLTKFSFLFFRQVWSMMCTVDSPPFKKALFLRRERVLMMTFTESMSSYR